MRQVWKNRRVLVTGGTGFIGSFLVEELLARGANVRVPLRSKNYRYLSQLRSEIDWLEGDLRDPRYCAKLCDGVDHVFHLAACRRTSEYHRMHASDVLTENVRMSIALMEALKEFPNIPATFFSTANVPASIDCVTFTKQFEERDMDGYVLGKALCELLWLAASRQRGFPLLIVRPIGVYGPRDTFSPEGNVIPSLFVRARASRDKLQVWGTGKQKRAFLYVEDLIRAVLLLVEADVTGVQYVDSSEVVEVRELAEKIRDMLRPDLSLLFDQSKPEGQRSRSHLPQHQLLRSFAWTPLEEGLKRTVEWWTHSAQN
jgi:GDP-L-fucose synthase